MAMLDQFGHSLMSAHPGGYHSLNILLNIEMAQVVETVFLEEYDFTPAQL